VIVGTTARPLGREALAVARLSQAAPLHAAARPPRGSQAAAHGRKRNGQAGDHAAKAVEHRHRDALQAFFLLLVVLAVALLANTRQDAEHRLGRGERLLRRLAEFDVRQHLACIGRVHPREQHLADRRAVKRIAPADARLHAQPVIGVNLVNVDDCVFVKCAQVHRLARQLADAAHFHVGFAHEIHAFQRLRAELEQTNGQTVALGLHFLRHEAERLERLHDPMHGGFRHAEPLRQFADADLPAVADCAENREHAANRRSRFGFLAAAFDAVRVVGKGRGVVLALLSAGCCHFRDFLVNR